MAKFTKLNASDFEETPMPAPGESAFHGAGNEWGASYALAGEVAQIVCLGNEYAEAEEWQNAATVYRVVAEEVLDNYEVVYDDEGEVLSPVNDCVEGLSNCLDHITEAAAREGILRALRYLRVGCRCGGLRGGRRGSRCHRRACHR